MQLKKRIERILSWAAAALIICSVGNALAADTDSDSQSDGKVWGKAVYDFRVLGGLTDFIDFMRGAIRTYDNIKTRGAEPDLVFILRSVSKQQAERMRMRSESYAPSIRAETETVLAELLALPGVRMIADDITHGLIDSAVKDQIQVVDDIYLELIQYQAQGYSLVTFSSVPLSR